MRRRFILVFSLLILTVLTAYPVLAQTESTSKAPQNNKKSQQRLQKREQRQQQRAALKEKLKTFRDTRRKARVEALDQKMAAANQRRTANMQRALDRFLVILEKMTERINTAKQNGQDTTTAEAAITAATTAINTSKIAVEEQMAEEYVFTITSEDTVRLNVKPVIQKLHNDLKGTHQTVLTARQAVINAAKAVALLLGREQPKESADSAVTQ